MKNRAFGAKTGRGTARLRQCRNFQRIGEAMLPPARLLLYAQSARRCYGRRVHHVDLFVQDGVQHARKHRAAKQVRTHFGDFACVANADSRGARRRRLRDQRPEPLRQFQIGPHAAVLIGGKRRKVHRVANDSFRQVILDLHGHLRANFFLSFRRGARHMRRGNYVWQPNERRILRRFFGEHVHRGAGKLAAFQRFGKRRLVHEFAARGVDDARAILHFLDVRLADDILSRGTKRGVQRNKIAFRQQLIERHKFDRHFARRRFADERVVGQHAHVKRFRAHGHFAADSAQADQAQRLPAHFGSRRGRFFPAPLVDGLVQARHLPRQRQQQREGVLCHAHGVSPGRAHHQHAALGGGFQVDVVHAHACSAHGAQLRRFSQQIRGDFRRASHNQCVGIGNFPFESFLRRQDRVPACLRFQQLHATFADLVRNDDLHHSPLLCCSL